MEFLCFLNQFANDRETKNISDFAPGSIGKTLDDCFTASDANWNAFSSQRHFPAAPSIDKKAVLETLDETKRFA
jgi:hypothetical protein